MAFYLWAINAFIGLFCVTYLLFNRSIEEFMDLLYDSPGAISTKQKLNSVK